MSEDLLRETSQVRDLMEKDQKARDDEKRFKDKEVIFIIFSRLIDGEKNNIDTFEVIFLLI